MDAPDLDSLSPQQRDSLESYRAVTGTDDVGDAVHALSRASWNVEVAVTEHLDGPAPQATTSYERLDVDDTLQDATPSSRGVRRPARPRPQPSGPLGQLWAQLRPYLRGPIAILSLPVSIALSVLSSALGFLARLLRIRPSFPTLSLRRGGPALAADPRSCAERWIRGLEEQAGVRGLPRFEACGYEEALRKAKEEMRPMLAIVLSEEHDDTPEFKRNVLSDPELLQCLDQHRFVVWGGDIRDRDAYITSHTLDATTYPFLAFITLQPPKIAPGQTAPATQVPKMTLFSRLEGPPSSTTSATAILAHLNSTFLPRTSSYLERIRNEKSHRDAERRLRAEQDAAYAAAGRRDAEKIQARRSEVAAAERAKRQAAQTDQWRRWAKSSMLPEPTSGGARLAVKLPDGRRILRRFDETTTTTSDIYRWIEGEAFAGATMGSDAFPAAYEHTFDFKVAQMIPRRSLEVAGAEGRRTLAELGGLTGGANLVVEGLRMPGAAEDSDEELED